MPWLLMITATHMLLINKSTGKYPVLTFILTIFSFFMVLYATFLTRSGILGNSSVHSFTDLGLSGQLILLLFCFIFLTYSLSFSNRKFGLASFLIGFGGIMFLALYHFNVSSTIISSIGAVLLIGSTIWFIKNLFGLFGTQIETDKLYSREFWMFVGSMVLLLSGFQIITMTSIPVFNKLFGSSMASAGEDYYNQVQIWFAIPIVLLTAIGQYFKYKKSDSRKVLESIANSLLIAIVISIGALFLFDIWKLQFLLLVIASIYAITGNVHYIITALKGKIKVAGASLAHAGFGLMMLGVLVSSVNKKILSVNTTGTGYFSETNAEGKPDENAKEGNRENILLAKNRTLEFADKTLRATYKTDREESPNRYFVVKYEVLDKEGNVKDSFTLEPNTQNNPKMGMVSNPDTRHYLTRDIFTHVTFESSMEQREDKEFDNFKTDTVKIGESFPTADGNRQLTLKTIKVLSAEGSGEKLHLQAEVVINSIGDTFIARPEFISEDRIRIKESIVDKAGVMVIFDRVMPDPNNPKNMLFILSSATRRPKMDYIILKAIEFPYINLLWLGTFVLIIGFVLAIIQRFKEAKRRIKQFE
ncbi:MAG: cytochrome c-type biogenesis CcmF C-terminal domain-containing protein [Bacteroidia bacterium]